MDVAPPQRESIFSSATRVFFKMFFGLLGLFIAMLVFAFIYSSFSPSPLLENKTTLSLVPDAEGKRELLPMTDPVILQINIHGIIGDPQKVNAELMQNVLLDSRSGFLANNRVKGILLHFNTPGGTVVDSDDIYRMLNEYKEQYKIPIYGYVDGLCASGGMYIASSADKMFAGPASIIGSVGVVIGPFFNIYDFMGKVGLKARTITAGIDKDEFNPTKLWKEGEGTSIQTITEFMYRRFVDVVTTARPQLDKTKLIQEYGAHVFDCVTAEKLGYVDHAMTSRDMALKELLIAANIESGHHYQVVSLTPKNPWLSEIVSGKSPLFSGKIEHTFDSIPRHIREQPCYLYRYE